MLYSDRPAPSRSGRTWLLSALLIAASPLAAQAGADPGRPFLSADMGAYLHDADMLWSWSAAAGPLDPLAPLRWFQSAYLGNGLLGASVTAVIDPASNATTGLRIDVSRTDVWECEQREPTGFLLVQPSSWPLARVDMRLRLYSAQLFVNFSLASDDVVSFSMLVNAADPQGPTGLFMLFVSTLTGGEDPLIVSFTPDTSGPCSDAKPVSGQVASSWGRPTFFTTQTFSTGTVSAAWTDFNDDCGQTILLAVANSQRAANKTASLSDAVAAVAAGYALTIEGLEAANSAWWGSFWEQTSFFSFDSAGLQGVTKLEQFAHIAGYRYASAARFTMHDLMGPWGPSHATTCIGPWCQFCWDMNQQVMLYLPSPSNRGLLLAKPAFDMLPSALNTSWTSTYGSNGPSGSDNILWFTAQAWKYCLYHG